MRTEYATMRNLTKVPGAQGGCIEGDVHEQIAGRKGENHVRPSEIDNP